MYCKNCGELLDDNNFCAKCGRYPNESTNSQVDTPTNVINAQVGVAANAATNTQVGNSINVVDNTSVSTVRMTSANTSNNSNNDDGKGTASLVLGIVSLVLSSLGITFISAIIGLVLGAKSKDRSGKKTAGIITNAIALVISIVVLLYYIFFVGLFFAFLKNEIEYSEDNNIEYECETEIYETDDFWLEFENDEWELSESYEYGEMLVHESGCTLYYSGKESLSYIEEDLGEEYDYYYNSDEITDNIWKYVDGYRYSDFERYENSFYTFITDDYNSANNVAFIKENSRGEVTEMLYCAILYEIDTVFFFSVVECEDSDVEDVDNDIYYLFDSMSVYVEDFDIYEDDTYEDDTYEDDESIYLPGMEMEWDIYEELRTGELGTAASLEGGWRVLSESEMYWEFNGNAFRWYKSVNDKTDNYWQGTYEVNQGKAGLLAAGVDVDAIDGIIERSDGEVAEEDFYTIILTPTTVISDGVDKSDTNIPEGTVWTYVWIIVDHGDEGIEGQVLDVDAQETTYYVKIKDL